MFLFFFNDTATTEIYTLSLHDALPICISLYALAKLLEIILKWDFDISIWVAAGIVMIYTFMGGLTSAVYNEVLQFFLIVRSEEHTSELQSRQYLVCRLLLEKKKKHQ